MSSKFIVWYEDKKYDRREDIAAEELIAKYKNSGKKIKIITDEIYVNGKYAGEVDYSFEEFCEYFEINA